MELDLILRDTIDKVKTTIKKKLDYDLTDEQIIDIISSQAKGIKDGMNKKVSIRLPHIGLFMIRNGRAETIETNRLAKEMGLKGQERLDFIEQRKKEWREMQPIKEEKIKEVVKEIPKEIVKPKSIYIR